uniref:ubiquitinyl hydrolase 1 n=1 Tax=Macrostomum lignano TaxID=282301 RepID=A0A1I8IZT9_9PLAT
QRRTGQSLSQILANHSAVINSFDQETLDQLSPNRLSTSPGLTGLRNLGNSCYANCVLQCLSNTVLLATHFLAQPPEPPANESSSAASSKSAGSDAVLDDADSRKAPAEHRRELLEALPGAVVRRVRQQGVRSSRMRRSFLLFLLDGMHEDLNRRSTGKAFESSLASLEVNSVESTAPGQQQHQEISRASLAW